MTGFESIIADKPAKQKNYRPRNTTYGSGTQNQERICLNYSTANPYLSTMKGINMENVLEKMKRIDGKRKIADFIVKQKMDYSFKVKYATIRAREFVRECDMRDLNYHVSVGGLDSITLFLFLKSIGIDAPGISVSYLEDLSIQRIHKQLGIERLASAAKPDGTRWTKSQIIQEFGFPVLSKEIAAKIETLANPTEKNKTVRHAIITGETGEYGGFQKKQSYENVAKMA